ncbi:MAG: tetratricopeptide repeat protein [Planctomycetes bacterium]|nr:tetratricopeptide repeat protein [Planctomycetota bacterium]
MRIRLNVRLLIGTLLVLALAGTGIHFLHAYQIKRNAGLLLKQVDRAVEEGKPDLAATLLDWYLTFEPTDTEALAKHGLLLEKLARTPAARDRAILKLEDALRRDPGRTDVRYRLAICLLSQGKARYPAAIKHLQALQPVWPEPGEIEHTIGWSLQGLGDYPQAVEWFRKAIAKSPSRLASYAIQAEILKEQLDQAEEADQVMDQMVAANANWHRAYLERARFRQKAGQVKEADQDIARGLELAPE